MAPITLQCTFTGCTAGEAGGRYKTPLLEPELVMEMLRSHRADEHAAVAVGGQAESAGKNKAEKVPSPVIRAGIGQDEFLASYIRPNYRSVTAEDMDLVLIFMTSQATEPGYP